MFLINRNQPLGGDKHPLMSVVAAVLTGLLVENIGEEVHVSLLVSQQTGDFEWAANLSINFYFGQSYAAFM